MSPIKTPHRATLGTAALAATFAAADMPANTQNELIRVEPAHATMFQNGGIGAADEQCMHRTAKDRYRITARWHGSTATREVTLDAKMGRDVAFRW